MVCKVYTHFIILFNQNEWFSLKLILSIDLKSCKTVTRTNKSNCITLKEREEVSTQKSQSYCGVNKHCTSFMYIGPRALKWVLRKVKILKQSVPL